MLDKRIGGCPFRVVTTIQTNPDGTKRTTQEFEKCLHERCPAYNRRQGNYGAYIETCNMFTNEMSRYKS